MWKNTSTYYTQNNNTASMNKTFKKNEKTTKNSNQISESFNINS